MDTKALHRISNHPQYQHLVKTRSRFGWSLTFTVLVIYFGFIYLVAFHKDYLATSLSDNSVITWSIPVGIGVIVLTILLTGIYVRRANSEFDQLTEEIKKGAHK